MIQGDDFGRETVYLKTRPLEEALQKYFPDLDFSVPGCINETRRPWALFLTFRLPILQVIRYRVEIQEGGFHVMDTYGLEDYSVEVCDTVETLDEVAGLILHGLRTARDKALEELVPRIEGLRKLDLGDHHG